VLAFLVLFVLSSTVFAQDWVEDENGLYEYNCDLVQTLIDEYGDEDIIREGSTSISIEAFFELMGVTCDASTNTSASSDIESTIVLATGNANIRDCASTSCGIVTTVASGDRLTVLSSEDGWYEIETERGTQGFIADFLTEPTFSTIIETEEAYQLEELGCVLVVDMNRGDSNVNYILTGNRSDDIFADLQRPSDSNPLRVDNQYDKTFIDTGDTYILQTYRWNVSFPTGIYRLDISLDGKTETIGWNMEERADYNIFVSCD
jgi:hypothetical protein